MSRKAQPKRRRHKILESLARKAIDSFPETVEPLLGHEMSHKQWIDHQYWRDVEDGLFEDWDYVDDLDYKRVGTHYKKDNQTYLCCRVHGCVVFVDVFTGEQANVYLHELEKVG